MKDFIASILSPIAQIFYDVFLIIPLWVVRAGIFAVLAALAIWVIKMPPQVHSAGDDASGGKMDLRYFALFVLGLQAVLYILF